MEPIIAGRDLRKSWGATLVLEHADFLLHAGDKVALVGPNGSGKSTLFRLLAGRRRRTWGTWCSSPGLRYGYIPQVPNVPGGTVVRDVLSAPSPEAQRIQADLAGLEAWMSRPNAWDAADASARMARFRMRRTAASNRSTNPEALQFPAEPTARVGIRKIGKGGGVQKSCTHRPNRKLSETGSPVALWNSR